MLGTGCAAEESESSNEYFRLSSTNSWLIIALARRGFVGECVSTLGVGEGCLYYDIILKTAKRHRAARRYELERFMTNDKPGSGRIRLANLAPRIMPAEPGMNTSILAMPVV
jgi:hypothetical protein